MEIPPLPDPAAHIWDWFSEIHRGRRFTEYGPLPISHIDLAAWILVTGITPNPWEVQMIHLLDQTFLEAMKPPKEAANG